MNPFAAVHEPQPSPEEVRADLTEEGLTPGTTRRIHGKKGCQYFVRLDDGGILTVTASKIRATSREHAAYILTHDRFESEAVPAGEAFAFLHGDYDPDTTEVCIECHVRFDGDTESPCRCDAPTVIDDVEYPDITPRRPRAVIDGDAVEVA
jgi:hypothetical protein